MTDQGPFDWAGNAPILRRIAEQFDSPAQRATHDYLHRLADRLAAVSAVPAVVERVARAMYAHDENNVLRSAEPVSWRDLTENLKDNYRNLARAALAALAPEVKP